MRKPGQVRDLDQVAWPRPPTEASVRPSEQVLPECLDHFAAVGKIDHLKESDQRRDRSGRSGDDVQSLVPRLFASHGREDSKRVVEVIRTAGELRYSGQDERDSNSAVMESKRGNRKLATRRNRMLERAMHGWPQSMVAGATGQFGEKEGDPRCSAVERAVRGLFRYTAGSDIGPIQHGDDPCARAVVPQRLLRDLVAETVRRDQKFVASHLTGAQGDPPDNRLIREET